LSIVASDNDAFDLDVAAETVEQIRRLDKRTANE